MRRAGCIVLFILASLSARAQDIPNSVYSSFGYGNLHERSSAYTRAMGNTSIAVRNDVNINATNPAALTAVVSPVTSMFEIGSYYGSTYINTTEASNSTKYGSLAGINYWFRLSKKWASLVGASPVSNTTYSVVAPRVLAGNASVPIQSDGKGGINQFYFSNAVDIIKNLSLGATFSYYLGTVKRSDFVPATGVSSAFEAEQQLTAAGANLDFGLQYTIPFNLKAAKEHPLKKGSVTIGLTFDHGASLHGSNQTALVNPVTFDTIRANAKTNLYTRLPAVYGAGLGFKKGHSTVAVDFRYMNWTIAAFDLNYAYQKVYKPSIGYEYHGDLTSFNYLKTISYRAGFWMQNYPLLIQGTKLNTWGYTVGLALPIQTNRATIALNYSFTQLGYARGDLLREQARILSMDIIVRDIWGVKRKFD